MENFQRNKIVGDVFVNYLRQEFNWRYETVEPRKKYIPDVDLILISKKQEDLFLQLKQVIKWEKTYEAPKGVRAFAFEGGLFNQTIEKTETRYNKRGNNISQRILILHSGLYDYLIPRDTFFIKKDKFKKSYFRGIYIVSPKKELWSADQGKEIQDEFVFEIKDAFN